LNYVLTNRDLAQNIGNKLIEYSESESWDTAAKRTISNYRKTIGFRSSNHKKQ
jgi:hypothetical protein